MSARTSRRAGVAALFVLGGCSAIVQPDPSRLGGMDGGGGVDTGSIGTDTGPLTDTGPSPDASVDAYRPLMPDAGSDAGPACPDACDDGVACTDDRCGAMGCEHTPNDALCPGERCSATTGCVPVGCTEDADCDDGDRCNGAERCVPGSSPTGCVAGTPPDCNDGVSCTDDHCAPARGCFHERFDARCDDGVACTTDVCAGTAGPSGCEYRMDDTMCNDVCTMGGRCTSSGCTPSVPRMCRDDGNPCTVESCDAAAGGCTSDPIDADADGYPAASVVSEGSVVRCGGGTDCNDMSADVHPGAMEICGNGIDDDCNPSTTDVCGTGDACADALPIALSGGTGSATVSLASLTNDYSTACGGDMGHDAVFYFDVSTTSEVRIETTGAVDTVLATATSCSGDAFRNRCNDDRDVGVNNTSRLWVRPVIVTPGATVRLYVLVDEYTSGDADPVTVTVTLTAPTPNMCPGAGPRPLDLSGGGTVIGNLGASVGASAIRGSCQPVTSTAPEAVFRIDEADRNLGSLDASSAGFVPDLYVRWSGCATGTEVACVRGTSGSGSGGTAHLESVMGTGTSSNIFYVFLDNFPMSGGEYQLRFDP